MTGQDIKVEQHVIRMLFQMRIWCSKIGTIILITAPWLDNLKLIILYKWRIINNIFDKINNNSTICTPFIRWDFRPLVSHFDLHHSSKLMCKYLVTLNAIRSKGIHRDWDRQTRLRSKIYPNYKYTFIYNNSTCSWIIIGISAAWCIYLNNDSICFRKAGSFRLG